MNFYETFRKFKFDPYLYYAPKFVCNFDTNSVIKGLTRVGSYFWAILYIISAQSEPKLKVKQTLSLMQSLAPFIFVLFIQVKTKSSCYVAWVWTGFHPLKIFPSQYIILNKCTGICLP